MDSLRLAERERLKLWLLLCDLDTLCDCDRLSDCLLHDCDFERLMERECDCDLLRSAEPDSAIEPDRDRLKD